MKNPIIEQAASYYGVTCEQLTTKNRKEPLATIRAVTMKLLHESGMNDLDIAISVGLNSHGASWTMRKRITARMDVDATLAADFKNLLDGKKSDKTIATEWAEHRAKKITEKRSSYSYCKTKPQEFCGIELKEYVNEPKGAWYLSDTIVREDGYVGFGSLKILEQQLQNL